MKAIFISIVVTVGLGAAFLVFDIVDASKGRLSALELTIACVGGLLTFALLALAFGSARKDASSETKRELYRDR